MLYSSTLAASGEYCDRGNVMLCNDVLYSIYSMMDTLNFFILEQGKEGNHDHP